MTMAGSGPAKCLLTGHGELLKAARYGYIQGRAPGPNVGMLIAAQTESRRVGGYSGPAPIASQVERRGRPYRGARLDDILTTERDWLRQPGWLGSRPLERSRGRPACPRGSPHRSSDRRTGRGR